LFPRFLDAGCESFRNDSGNGYGSRGEAAVPEFCEYMGFAPMAINVQSMVIAKAVRYGETFVQVSRQNGEVRICAFVSMVARHSPTVRLPNFR
jgi:hypothetical protein